MDTQTGRFITEEQAKAMEDMYKQQQKEMPKDRLVWFGQNERIEIKGLIWEVVKCRRNRLILKYITNKKN